MRAEPAARATPSPASRALFLYSPVGGGHLHASRAIATAWLLRNRHGIAQQIDYLRFLPALERRLWPGLYHLSLRYCPAAWRRYRKWTHRPNEPKFIRDRVTHTGADAFASLLGTALPEVVVSTIGGAADLAGTAREKTGVSFLNVLVVSGFRAHHHWARKGADLFFVSSDEAKADLVSRDIDPARIVIVGIPIDPELRALTSDERARLRQELGLGDDPVLLVSSGATGAYRAHRALLDTIARLNLSLDVVTFKDEPREVEHVGRARIHRLGYRQDFCHWLAASDLVVGKLGGQTAAEALAATRPIVVYEPIAGQEEENAEWVVKKGAALWPQHRAGLEDTLDELLSPGGRKQREKMADAARRLARPDAANEIVRVILHALAARR
jgi:processive 1,2-diacylglycerol beta-glucosyltransferase